MIGYDKRLDRYTVAIKFAVVYRSTSTKASACMPPIYIGRTVFLCMLTESNVLQNMYYEGFVSLKMTL